MRLLLDTHALLWSVLDDPRLSHSARMAITEPDAEILISSVSIFEITQKHRIGKLQQAEPFVLHHEQMLKGLAWTALPVDMRHAALAGSMDIAHKDPFDRLLIAQARIERVPLVSIEAIFDGFGVDRIW